MASKHLGASVASKASIFPVMQTAQQAKSKFPPLSPLSPACILKDLQDALEKQARQIKEEMEVLIENIFMKLTEDIEFAFQKFVGHIDLLDERIDVAENFEKLKDRINKVENNVEIIQDEVTMLQYKNMEFALRIRGMKENIQEDLRQVVVKDIALILGAEPEEILRETEKVFRVNSRVARQRNLPRDVVIYFSRRSLCNEILQAFYKQRFQIAAQDVIILKEIPSKILRKRKDFAFLVDELKKRQVRFRWDIPVGIVLNYAGIYYRLNTMSKAKDFYISVLKVGSPLFLRPEIIEEKLEEQPVESAMLLDVGDEQAEHLQQSLETEDFLKEPRMTRAAYRLKLKELQKIDVGIKKRK